jgi:hypothetical protein
MNKRFFTVASSLLCIFLIIATVSFLVSAQIGEQTLSETIVPTEVAAVQQIEECKDVFWEEERAVFGTCATEVMVKECSDPPANKSCTETRTNFSFSCETGKETIQHTQRDCVPVGYLINDQITLSTKEYACSLIDDGKVYVTCDSRYDGNGDGICTSGESCMRFGIVGNFVTTEKRNSQDEFTESDDSFFLDEAKVEVFE